MAIKIFLLGRPGAGKSTAARVIRQVATKHHWSTRHINDYQFLRALFEADTEFRQFQPSCCGGFDVKDFSVLDTALHAVEKEATQYLINERQFLLLEFARDDYYQALCQFQATFLQDAYFLFFNTDIETCVQRVYQRSRHPAFHDDHFISEEMIRGYYHADFPLQTSHRLRDYGLSEKHITIINNSGSRIAFYKQIKTFIDALISRHAFKVLCTSSTELTDMIKYEGKYPQPPTFNEPVTKIM